jgi:hypothetical protein
MAPEEGGWRDLKMRVTTVAVSNRKRNKGSNGKVAKLTTQGYDLLPPGEYVLEVMAVELADEYGPQLALRNRVAEGEYKGFEFTDYPNRGAENGVKVGTKAWDTFEACLDRRLAPDEELDTQDLIGKKFVAMVVVKKNGKGNRTEHGTIRPYRPKQAEPKEEPEAKNSDKDEEDFENLPF